jgi:peptidoglycan DL-endopeptidase CwlO
MDSIAADAMKYQGVPYVWGKASPSGWDCSGFVNYVLGHDLGFVLPGNVKDFSGTWHGPVVAQYATWKSAGTIKGPPEAGDLCVWIGVGASGHIGIALGADRMISALDPQQGTCVTPIKGYGPAGAPLIYRRVGQVGNLTNQGILNQIGCGPQIAGLILVGGYKLWQMKHTGQ